MTIDTKELRSMVSGAQFESFANSVIHSLLDRIEAAESERDELRAKLERVEKQRDGLIGTMRVIAARPAVDEGRNNWEAIVWESICFAEEAIDRATGEQP